MKFGNFKGVGILVVRATKPIEQEHWVTRNAGPETTYEIQSEFQSLVHHLLCLAVILVLILSPVCDDLLQLAVEGGEKTFPLLILSLQTGQHQWQEWLLTQQRHTERGRKKKVTVSSWFDYVPNVRVTNYEQFSSWEAVSLNLFFHLWKYFLVAYLFCFCLSLSLREEEPKCWPFSSSSPAAFSTWPWTAVDSLAISGATSHTPERSDELGRLFIKILKWL